jgi:hypothetical protein
MAPALGAITFLLPERGESIGKLGFFGVLRLRLARSAAPDFAQDDGFIG